MTMPYVRNEVKHAMAILDLQSDPKAFCYEYEYFKNDRYAI